MKFKWSYVILIGLIGVFALSLVFVQSEPAFSQSGETVECGTKRESVFVDDNESKTFLLEMEARESFNVSVEPVGTNMEFYLGISGPTGVRIDESFYHERVSVSSGVLSADGIYTIHVANSHYGVGIFILSVGCKTNDGQIAPGDVREPTPTSAPVPTATTRPLIPTDAPVCTGPCFPGLAPIDLSTIISTSMVMEVPVVSVIPIGNEIVGFTFDAEEGDTVSLSYTKLSGTMEAGLVVLSEENDIVFFTNLIASQSLSTTLAMPSTGSYTIAAFRVNLTNQENPVPVMFNLEASIESEAGE